MLALAGLDQAGAQQRTALQIERLVRLLIGQRLQALLALLGSHRAEVMPLHLQWAVLGDALVWHAVDAREGGAQGFVTGNQRMQGALEGIHVQGAAQARHAADVVGRAVRLHLPEEPHALLRIRQRHRLAPVDPRNSALLVMLAALAQPGNLDTECAQLAGIEQGLQRQLDVQRLACARDDLGGQQRMAAEGEEVILQAHLRHAEHFAPDCRDLLLQRSVRLDVLALLPDRRRQRLALDLAARADGHLSKVDQLRRDHIGRQALAQCGQQRLALLVTGVIAEQLRTNRVLLNQHHGLRDAQLSQQA
ncbi:hypothetical protein PS623_04670 [Pseudomonas fluorescens]|nr:hypothetical protein PS623_04670 [Pseudomonas fluorescens]